MQKHTGIDLYKKWAPAKSLWSPWVKPTLFRNSYGGTESVQISTSPKNWLNGFKNGTLLIIDLPGEESILEGLSLCRQGFRPVPLYNCINPTGSYVPVISVSEIVDKFNFGVQVIQESSLASNAPPAFLLDARRLMSIGSSIGMYDNRWCLFPQDMPSADFIKKQGIQYVIVRTDSIRNDLVHILKRYQDSGIAIFICDNDIGQARKVKVNKPSLFKSLSYRASAIKGLLLNTSGGFGGYVPLPSSGHSG